MTDFGKGKGKEKGKEKGGRVAGGCGRHHTF